MLIKINNEELDLEDGSTIKDAINKVNAPYSPGSIVCVIKGEKELEKSINKYKIKTTKGSIVIELSEKSEAKPLVDVWKAKYSEFEGLKVRWTTSNETAIGPIKTDFKPTKEEFNYSDADVIMSLSGFSSESTHMIFSKDDHKGVYAVPDHNKGVFAKITGGLKKVTSLEAQDKVISIEPVIERSTFKDIDAISDIDTVLKEGNQIITYISIKPETESPQGVEHFFSLSIDSTIEVDYESNTFLGFYELQGIEKPFELNGLRNRGTVTIRNTGKGTGKIYIYREDRVSASEHSVIGKVEEGMELIDIAKKGDKLTVRSNPERIMVISLTQKEAEEELSSRGITTIRAGDTSDDAIVVMQEPRYSVNISNEKEAKTIGIAKEDLVLLSFTDNAPDSLWYFKKVSGLLDSPIGQLKVHFAFPGMNLLMFEGDKKISSAVIPENTPVGSVKAGEIGITNMARKNTGVIGVRLENNNEFGPTGEPFNGTNIVGKVINDLELLKKYKEGDIIYVFDESRR